MNRLVMNFFHSFSFLLFNFFFLIFSFYFFHFYFFFLTFFFFNFHFFFHRCPFFAASYFFAVSSIRFVFVLKTHESLSLYIMTIFITVH